MMMYLISFLLLCCEAISQANANKSRNFYWLSPVRKNWRMSRLTCLCLGQKLLGLKRLLNEIQLFGNLGDKMLKEELWLDFLQDENNELSKTNRCPAVTLRDNRTQVVQRPCKNKYFFLCGLTGELESTGCRDNQQSKIGCLCEAGYRLSKDFQCQDVDECEEDQHKCEDLCTNTQGSYLCGCRSGYRLDSSYHFCDDVNECQENQHACQHQCTNTMGSYFCWCLPGFQLGPDGHACIRKDISQLCPCKCQVSNGLGIVNYKQTLGNNLRHELAINTREVSKERRSKISVLDHRVSSKIIGLTILSVCLFCLMFMVVP